MSDTSYQIIHCPNCGKRNRVGVKPKGTRAICAVCKAPLDAEAPGWQERFEAAYDENTPRKSGVFAGLGGILLAVLIMKGFVAAGKVNSNRETVDRIEPPSVREITDLSIGAGAVVHGPEKSEPLALPDTGVMKVFSARERSGPFKIRNDKSVHQLVVLNDVQSREPSIIFFIRMGDEAEQDVPIGTYRVATAFGKDWYGLESLFGKNTRYQEFDAELTFERGIGHEITLYGVPDGNLKSEEISKEKFKALIQK